MTIIFGLEGATIQLYSEDTKETKKLKTDSTGTITFNDLYRFVEGKYITGKYTIKEIDGPQGYATNSEEINFVTTLENGELNINIENKENLTVLKETQIEGNTIKLILQDKPLFKLTKVDKDGNKPLANTKFIIYKTDSEYINRIDFAKDVNDNYIGEKNDKDQYVVTTNENGEIIIPLQGGYYQAVEIEATEGYEKSTENITFKVDGFQEKGDVEINSIEDLIDFSNDVNSGITYEGKKISLMKNLDFENDNSYENPNDLKYKDYNGDGEEQGIKAELTKRDGNSKGFNPIGNEENAFKGIFDGNGYEIRNIYINRCMEYSGLFGKIEYAKILNLGLSNGVIKHVPGKADENGNTGSAAIVGNANNYSTISNVYSDCEVMGDDSNANNNYLSGIVAKASNRNTITNCYNLGYIHAKQNSCVAGILAWDNGPNDISYSYNKGMLEGDYFIGGIVASTDSLFYTGRGGTYITGCYNDGEFVIESKNELSVGGIVGGNSEDLSHVYFRECYNLAEINLQDIESEASVGGIFGKLRYANVQECNNYGKLSVSAKEMNPNTLVLGGIGGKIIGYSSYNSCHNEGEISIINEAEGYRCVGGIVRL